MSVPFVCYEFVKSITTLSKTVGVCKDMLKLNCHQAQYIQTKEQHAGAVFFQLHRLNISCLKCVYDFYNKMVQKLLIRQFV